MKDYKRLTKRWLKDSYEMNCARCNELHPKQYEHQIFYENDGCHELLKQRLGELEDKIEQGLLVELPCKVGDTVYSIPFDGNKKIFEHKVKDLRLLFISESKDCNHIENNFAWFGENIFLTKAEAEAKLAELRGER